MIPEHPPHRIRLARPTLGEEELDAVRRVFASGVLTDGPATVAFEQAFAARHQVAHAVAFSSGTSALLAGHLALGIGPGDEVVVPSMTFISTATSVRHAGATAVFADVRPDTLTLDVDDVARRLTPRTKAIVAVHYAGQAADLAELRALADDAGIALVEDAAEAHGASYRGRPVGGVGELAMFSFTPTKNITTGEGGMITTDDGDLATRLRLLRNHGQTALDRHELLGFNFRLSEMQAAIGEVQLGKLDQVLERKRANAAVLDGLLQAADGIRPPQVAADRDHVYMLYTVLFDGGRDHVLDGLTRAGVESRIYFPPAHQQPLFADEPTHLPVTEDLAGRMLSLPVHAGLAPDELVEVGELVVELQGEAAAATAAAPAPSD